MTPGVTPISPVHKMEATLLNYGEDEILDGQIAVAAASATFVQKGEDRHAVFFHDHVLEDCQRDWPDYVPRLAAYVGLFDGHDGPRAADYCYHGLLQHMLVEIEDCVCTNRNNRNGKIVAIDGTHVTSPLDAGIINAFHQAEERFATNSKPPTVAEVRQGPEATRADGTTNQQSRICCPRPSAPRGGTTALTLSIFGERYGPEDDGYHAMPFAIVANTGDCRMLTDDGSGSREFRQVTHDHRPTDPQEHRRLEKYVESGGTYLGREYNTSILRVYPGGLAVSRSVGDLAYSKAVVCTPELYRVPISGKKTQRFIIACDGLWDCVSNETVGTLAARGVPLDPAESCTNTKESILSPSDAAARLMEHCLQHGGNMDDVTILVVDVTWKGRADS